jgi:hypothetical protein
MTRGDWRNRHPFVSTTPALYKISYIILIRSERPTDGLRPTARSPHLPLSCASVACCGRACCRAQFRQLGSYACRYYVCCGRASLPSAQLLQHPTVPHSRP